MKLNKRNFAVAALVLSNLTAITTGCGSAGGPIAATNQYAPANPNTVTNLNLMNNGMGNQGCVPINQPIGFQANGMYMDTQSIYAGVIPPYIDPHLPRGAVAGQVMTTPSATVLGAYQPVQNELGTIDGNITLNAMQTTGMTMGQMGNASGSGTIKLSLAKLQIIYGLFGLNYSNLNSPYSGGIPQAGFPSPGMAFNTPGMTQTQLQQQVPCVSGIAISMSHYGTTLYYGRVYLYLNGQQHGDYLQF